MEPPPDRLPRSVRTSASLLVLTPLASSVSKAGGASTSSARDSQSTICVLPPRSAEYYAQHDRPHSWKGKAAVNEHAAPSATVQAPSQHRPSVVVDYTDQFLVPDSPELPETGSTVIHNGRVLNLFDLEDDLDLIGSEDELHNTVEEDALVDMELEAFMGTEPEQGGTMTPAPEAFIEIEPEQGGTMTPAPEAPVEEPEQGGTMTPAPEAELEDIHMASASPALTN